MKGMLTGPVTILQWSFVRDDQPWAVTARQLALALRDEVGDLVAAGIPIVQIDEPALREGLPLRRADRAAFLAWATEAFRLARRLRAGRPIQIHTHMCYAEFGEIIDAIVDLDADVISMEASRSRMELLDDFVAREYPNEIGPGVWDIHSPRIPSDDELDELLRSSRQGPRLRPALGQPRLRPQDPCLARDPRLAHRARRRRAARPRPAGQLRWRRPTPRRPPRRRWRTSTRWP